MKNRIGGERQVFLERNITASYQHLEIARGFGDESSETMLEDDMNSYLERYFKLMQDMGRIARDTSDLR